MNLKKATIDDANRILEFYKNVIESIKSSEFKPLWNEKYPNLEYIERCISKNELYIYTDGNMIVSSFILNHEFDNNYNNVKWDVEAEFNEIMIIHTFAINSNYRSKGLSFELFDEIKKIAITDNQKTLRIDIVDGNTGAEKVFKKLGFNYITTVEISHYAVGLKYFHLYEYDLTLKKDRS